MKVSEIMARDLRACSPQTNLAAAASKMWERDCGMLPVVTEDARVVGIITDRDICIALGTRNRLAGEIAVEEAMSTDVAVCATYEDVGTAAARMRERRVRRLPVVGPSHTLQGVLSLDDLALHASAEPGAEIDNDMVAETLKALCEYQRVKAAGART